MPVQTAPNDSNRRESVSPANFLDWRRDTAGGSIRDLAAMEWWEANLMGRDEPEHAFGFYVSSSFFAAMGVSPALGRGFLPDEEVVEVVKFETADPDRILVVRATPQTTIEGLAKSSPIEKYAAQQLRLLNDLYPDKEPTAGQPIKIVK